MARHSFIQMSKLPNVKGRISYITSHARQENLYATYRTTDNEFWSKALEKLYLINEAKQADEHDSFYRALESSVPSLPSSEETA